MQVSEQKHIHEKILQQKAKEDVREISLYIADDNLTSSCFSLLA